MLRRRTQDLMEPLLRNRYGDKMGMNIVEVNHVTTVVQSLESHGNRTIALPVEQLTRCRASAHLIVSTERQPLVKGTLDNAWQALSPKGELVLYPCRWKEQDCGMQKAILKKFDYVTQHEFESPDESLVILRKR